MATSVVRENTLKLKFGAQSRNPSDAEVFAFFGKQGWNCDMLSAMYREDFSVLVKFQKEDLLKAAFQKLGHQVMFEYANGTKVQLSVSASNGMFKYVRVFGLPPEVDDQHLAAVLTKYGTIHQMVRERYPAESGFPIWSSVRGLNMELQQDIPAQVFVQSVKARVYYDGMQHKCYVCGSTEHLKAECPKRKSVNSRLSTYAHPVVNRSGLAKEGSSTGTVILPIPGGKVKDIEDLAKVSEVSPSTSACVEMQSETPSTDQQAECNLVGESDKVAEEVEPSEEKETSSGSMEGVEWQTVMKRLRSNDSNGGTLAKSIKIGNSKGQSLLKLQGRRSRSLTSKKEKKGKLDIGDSQSPDQNNK